MGRRPGFAKGRKPREIDFPWRPMEATTPVLTNEAAQKLRDTLEAAATEDGARPLYDPAVDEMFENDRYTVIRRLLEPERDTDGWMHLSIRRNDRRAVRDWRDLQRIKNDLAGPEREAIEVFPRESRLVDTSNQFHLWVLPAGDQVPFGFQTRQVAGVSVAEALGAAQREFADPPDDEMTAEDLEREIFKPQDGGTPP